MMSAVSRFCTKRMTPRRPLAWATRPVSSRPFSMRAMSRMRMGPLSGSKRRMASPTSSGSWKRLHMTTWRRSAALSSMPPVLETLRLRTVSTTSVMATPCSRARVGSTSTRTSGSAKPMRVTPATKARRSKRSSSASAVAIKGVCGPASTISSTGMRPGISRLSTGSSSMSAGKSVMASMAERRSIAAASIWAGL